MKTPWQRDLRRGIVLGLLAGGVLAVAEIGVTGLLGGPALTPVRLFASVVLGSPALTETPVGVAVGVGLVTHFLLSAVYGAVYGVFQGINRLEQAPPASIQLLLGLGYGVTLWFVNFQFIARVLYPWFLDAPQALQLVLHALFFGLPLGALWAAVGADVPVRRRAHGHV